MSRRRPDDVIISASPRFLLEPVCDSLGVVHLIASEVSPQSGRYTGTNCHGEEKVRRFHEQFADAPIEEFYTDSRSDEPMARLAEKAFIVKGEKIKPYRFLD